ncbi:MAG: carbohydrate ABC transporter permease [bacterium]|nr:carbohydrate ABC transporter permease [bacterium]
MKNSKIFASGVHLFFIINTLLMIIPFLLVLAISVSDEGDIAQFGYSLIPRSFDFEAYSILFQNVGVLVRAVIWTIFIALVSPVASLVITAMGGYTFTRSNFKFKGVITGFYVVMMFLGAGMMAGYIVNATWFKLVNNPLIYFIPGFSFWNAILFRTNFNNVPEEIIEAASIDGASEMKILWKIMLPMSKAIFGMLYFLAVVGGWNDYGKSLIYFDEQHSQYWTIQYILQRSIQNAEFLAEAYAMAGISSDLPLNTMKYCVCVISMVPLFIVFPYVQKYFAKGMAIGSVKG